MSISSIGASFIASAQNVSSGAGSTGSVASSNEEAQETQQTTIKEAQRGDPVAKRKLLQIQAKQQQQQQAAQPKASEPGKGASIDHEA